jgi:hypothetical protein
MPYAQLVSSRGIREPLYVRKLFLNGKQKRIIASNHGMYTASVHNHVIILVTDKDALVGK